VRHSLSVSRCLTIPQMGNATCRSQRIVCWAMVRRVGVGKDTVAIGEDILQMTTGVAD
jgi:hypothetical protein